MDVPVTSLIIAVIASIVGPLLSFRLTVYRLEQVEKRIDKLADVVERMVRYEQVQEYHGKRIAELEESERYEQRHRNTRP